jgi:hypothetical protein
MKSQLINKSQFENKSQVILKQWHKLYVVDNPNVPSESVDAYYTELTSNCHKK